MNNNDPLRNNKDPLRTSGPDAEQELFRAFGQAATGYPFEIALGAALNIILNGVRQSEETREGARAKFDELVSKGRFILLEKHYDAMGKRRNVFPFTQHIEVPLMKLGGNKH